jgi:hypothetical protein
MTQKKSITSNYFQWHKNSGSAIRALHPEQLNWVLLDEDLTSVHRQPNIVQLNRLLDIVDRVNGVRECTLETFTLAGIYRVFKTLLVYPVDQVSL